MTQSLEQLFKGVTVSTDLKSKVQEPKPQKSLLVLNLLMNVKHWFSEISDTRLKLNESVCMLKTYECEALRRLDIHCVISCIWMFHLNIYNPRALWHNMEMVEEFLCNTVLLMLLRLCELSCRVQQLWTLCNAADIISNLCSCFTLQRKFLLTRSCFYEMNWILILTSKWLQSVIMCG